MGSPSKQLIFGCEYAFLPAGVKAVQGKFDRILNSSYLRASCEYRHESRTFLVICSPEHEDGVSRMFQDILREVIQKEVGLEFRYDDGEIDSKLVSRVEYDPDNAELPREFVDKKQQWPSPISGFAFKSTWVYLTKNDAQPRPIPKFRQKALGALLGIELLEDLDSQCIYVGANSPECLANALKKLDMLKKQVDSFNPGDSHVFYTEHRETYQLSVRLIPSIKKRLQNTTLLDPIHNNGLTESYRALNLACTIRCYPFDPIRKIFVLKSGEKLFPLVSPKAKESVFLLWENYVYTKKGILPVMRQQNKPIPLIDFEENDVAIIIRQQNDYLHLADIEKENMSSVTQQRNNRLYLAGFEEDEVAPVMRQQSDQLSFLVDFEEDDAIPQLEPSERIQNVANWLLTDLPDIPPNASLQLSHGLNQQDQHAVKIPKIDEYAGLKASNGSLSDTDIITLVRPITPEQANPRAFRNGTHSPNLLELSPESDVDLLVPLDEDMVQNLVKQPKGKILDFLGPLKDGERGDSARFSPDLTAKSQNSMTCGSEEDLLHFSAQKPLLLESSKTQAQDGNLKLKLDTSKAPDTFATIPDSTENVIAIATPSALPPWNLDNKFELAIDISTKFPPTQTKAESEPVKKPANHKEVEDNNPQNHRTMAQRKSSSISAKATIDKSFQTDPATTIAKTSEHFNNAVSASTKSIITNMRWWQGEVTLEAQLGRILIRGFASHVTDAPENSSTAEQVSYLLKSASNSVQFTKILSTLPADAQFILDMKSDTNDQLWGPAAKKSVTYQYYCSFPGSERFAIEMDAESFKTRVKSLPSKLGCIYVHGTLRNFDYRIIASGTRNLDGEHDRLAKAIANTTCVDVKLNRVLLWFKLSKDLNVEIDAVRVHHRSHHISPNGKSILNINEVHDLDVDQAKSGKWMTYRAHSADSITQPRWYEMSVSSVALEEILQENSSLELGKEASWTEGTLTVNGMVLEDICLPTNLLIRRIDGLGFFNKNPNEPQRLLDNAETAPALTSSSTQEPQLMYW